MRILGKRNFKLRPTFDGSGIITTNEMENASGVLSTDINTSGDYHIKNQSLTPETTENYNIGASGYKYRQIHATSGEYNHIKSNEFLQGSNKNIIHRTHQGRREIFAGNNGLGQSAGVHSSGMSDTTSYAHGKGDGAFYGGTFDGESIWLAPRDSNDLIKINPSDGSFSSFAHGKGADAFRGAVFDGESVWLVPHDSNDVVSVDPSDGSMTSYTHDMGNNAFFGGTFDGEHVWLAPFDSNYIVSIDPNNPASGNWNFYSHNYSNAAYAGAVFDGQYIWMVSYRAGIRKIDPSTGIRTKIDHNKGIDAFGGGCFDGTSIWLAPYNSNDLVKIDILNNEIESYPHGEGGNAFRGACFDGASIWLAPRDADNIVKVNPADGTMTKYAHGKGAQAFVGAVFDGESVWMVPRNSDDIFRIRPQEFGRPSLHTTGPLNVGGQATLASGLDVKGNITCSGTIYGASVDKYSEIGAISTPSGDHFYDTINHSLGTEDIITKFYSGVQSFRPSKYSIVDSNNINLFINASGVSIKSVIIG